MNYSTLKRLAKKARLYRAARWFNRHVRDRRELLQERNDYRFYSSLLKRDDLVFDVGANIGQKTRVFLRLGTRVVAFEPQPDVRAELTARCGGSRRR